MSYSVTLRTGVPGNYQTSRHAFASFEAALGSAESAYASNGAEYCVDDERGTVTYRFQGMASPQE
jgi:hypothetical protein